MVRDLPLSAANGFVIAPSTSAVGTTSIPPDTAVCDDCLAEMRDPGDRRFGYPFIACTHCGPRFTIVTGLPYDRPGTTMADFPLCDACQREYDDPSSRRFHAQPTACPACGPRMSAPVDDIVQALRAGLVVAIKGIGGYHLACDASQPAAVATLRRRKQRGDKPFALMVRGLDEAHGIVDLDATASRRTHVDCTTRSSLRPSRDVDLQDRVAPGQRLPRRDAALRAPAPPALRRRSPGRPRDDERQRLGRADLHRRRGGRGAPSASRRPARPPRPAHPHRVRRLGRARRRRDDAARPAQPWVRPAPRRPAPRRASAARRRRGAEDHHRRGAGQACVDEPAHRRHAEPGDARHARPHRCNAVRAPASAAHRHRQRRPPRVPLPALGQRGGRASVRSTPDGPAPPRPSRLAAGRASHRAGRTGPRLRLRRHRLRHRRDHLGRRAPARLVCVRRARRPPAPGAAARRRCSSAPTAPHRPGPPARR